MNEPSRTIRLLTGAVTCWPGSLDAASSHSWFDWANTDSGLLDFTRTLLELRRENPALRPAWFRQAPGADATDTVRVLRADAEEFTDDDWTDDDAHAITFVLEHAGQDAFALLLNAAANGVEFSIPAAPNGEWELAASSDPGQQVTAPVSTLIVRDGSFTLLRSRR